MSYDFITQEKLFSIACQILEDYGIQKQSFSFGGGTALSHKYLNHRMSFDIDIFLDELSSVDIIQANRYEIMNNLGIPATHVKMSSNNVTFILDDNGAGLKLDFLLDQNVLDSSYTQNKVFGIPDIRTQSINEIIAKKIKFREILTVRDFVDFAIVEKSFKTITNLLHNDFFEQDRLFDIAEQLENYDVEAFNADLKYINPINYCHKDKVLFDLQSLTTYLEDDFVQVGFFNLEIATLGVFAERDANQYSAFGEYQTRILDIGSYCKNKKINKVRSMELVGATLSEISPFLVPDFSITNEISEICENIDASSPRIKL